jgi:hypothetical protein
MPTKISAATEMINMIYQQSCKGQQLGYLAQLE